MEPVSFIGVAGLVGTFTACVDCFEYIRIGRSLGADYQTAIIKLDLVRLRLTRWGRSVGIL
jgi:Prion-inhibition and propagation